MSATFFGEFVVDADVPGTAKVEAQRAVDHVSGALVGLDLGLGIDLIGAEFSTTSRLASEWLIEWSPFIEASYLLDLDDDPEELAVTKAFINTDESVLAAAWAVPLAKAAAWSLSSVEVMTPKSDDLLRLRVLPLWEHFGRESSSFSVLVAYFALESFARLALVTSKRYRSAFWALWPRALDATDVDQELLMTSFRRNSAHKSWDDQTIILDADALFRSMMPSARLPWVDRFNELTASSAGVAAALADALAPDVVGSGWQDARDLLHKYRSGIGEVGLWTEVVFGFRLPFISQPGYANAEKCKTVSEALSQVDRFLEAI